MATNFPTSLDSLTNPSSGDSLSSPSHSAQHANINDAMEAVQAKLGTGAGTIGEWTSYTPTISSSSGTLTTVSASAEYCEVNKLVTLLFQIDITAAGTGSGNIEMTLPVTPDFTIVGFPAIGSCYEGAQSADHGFVVRSDSTALVSIRRYDGATLIGNNRRVSGSLVYQAA